MRKLLMAAAAAVLAGVLWQGFTDNTRPSAAAPSLAAANQSELGENVAALKAEIERLKGIVPDQAHAMTDVGYQFSQLWFAGRAENWPLADFYLKETRSHLKWAVRIIPVRKDNAGQDIELGKILEALDGTQLAQLEQIIASQDKKGFEAMYRQTLEGCYACHKASDKPFLRVAVPEAPQSRIINFDPKATWPL